MRAAPLRLGYLVPEFPGQTHVFFFREAQALERLGVELHWLSTRRPLEPCPHAVLAEAAARTRYAYPPRWGRATRWLAGHPARAARALGYLAALRESTWAERLKRAGLLVCAADLAALAVERGFDHLHAHSCAEAAHLVALASRLSGVPYSLTLHGDLPVYGTDHAAKMSAARFVAVVTADLQRQVTRDVGLDPARVPVIRMGVDTQRFRPGLPRLGRTGSLRLATVARLAECKGHRFALQAMARLVSEGLDLSYVIAGGGPDRPLVEEEIVRLGLRERVRLAGSLGESEVLSLLQGSDVLVLPSIGIGEAAPVAVMEAMATGLPVVCSRVGGVPELVEDGREGLLAAPEDVDGLAAALRRLALDPSLRERFGRAARQRAENEFDAQRCAERLLGRLRPQV